MTGPPLRCVKESSEYSGIPVGSLYRLARLGLIRHCWEGRQLRFAADDLDEYLGNCSAEDHRRFLG